MQMFETGKPVYANDRFRRSDGFLCATVKKLIFFSTKFPCSRGKGGFDSQPITKVTVIDSSPRRGGSMATTD